MPRGHREVAADVAEIDHLLLEIDGVAGERLFGRLRLDLLDGSRAAKLRASCGRRWSTPWRSARCSAPPRTAGRRRRGSRACWRWRRCSPPPSAARTATAPFATRPGRDRCPTRSALPLKPARSSTSRLARGLPNRGGEVWRAFRRQRGLMRFAPEPGGLNGAVSGRRSRPVDGDKCGSACWSRIGEPDRSMLGAFPRPAYCRAGQRPRRLRDRARCRRADGCSKSADCRPPAARPGRGDNRRRRR